MHFPSTRASPATKTPKRWVPHAPPLALLAIEPVRAAAEFCVSLLGPQPRPCGDGHAVLVLPGLATGDWSTARMRRVLQRTGFDVHAWGRGVNRGPTGDFDEWLGLLEATLRAMHQRSGGRTVSLVGWSLGGIYARELAKRSPGLVRQVITLGSPFAAPGATRAGPVYRLLNGGPAVLTPEVERRLREDPSVPTTAIYSKTDGIVAWQGCLTRAARRSENIEVSRVSHCGLCMHPQVLRIVADRLAQPEGRWRRWKAPAECEPRRGGLRTTGA